MMIKGIILTISKDDFQFLCRIIMAANGFSDEVRLELLKKLLSQEKDTHD